MKPLFWISNVAFFVAAAFVGAILVLAKPGAADDTIVEEIERRMAAIHAELDRRDAIDERFDEIKSKTVELARRIRVLRGAVARRPASENPGGGPTTNVPGANRTGAMPDEMTAASSSAMLEVLSERLERVATLSDWTDEEREAVFEAYRIEASDLERAIAEDRGDLDERALAARSKRLASVRETLGDERFQRVAASLPEMPRFEIPREEY